MKRTIGGLVLGGWALLGLACGPSRVTHPGYNVIFVLVDTLRADHLASYGYPRETSPFLDRLARANVRFENVRSQAACTFPSVNSILTSRDIFRFQDPETRPGIPETVPTLAEILAARGYATAAVSASPIVRNTPSAENPKGGFGRGFSSFDERCLWMQSTCVSTIGLKTVDELAAPFFLYLHYMDPHDPYTPIVEYRGRFAEPYAGAHPFIAAGDPNPIVELIRNGEVDATLQGADFAHLIDLYDEEIVSLDAGLRQLFEGLETRGLLERSLVVIAADHGEGFFEHRRVKHCTTVFDTETRVPLILRLPRVATPIERSAWVENLDIVPTLLDYLGLDAGDVGFEGRSLRALIESDEAPGLAFSAMGAYRSVNDQRHKLILKLGQVPQWSLFDLVADPGETRNVAAEHRGELRSLRGELETWMARVEGDASVAERLRRAKEVEDELRAVGYLN